MTTITDPYLAKYPFIEDAREVMQEFDMGEVLQDEAVLDRAAQRITLGVSDGKVTDLDERSPGVFEYGKGGIPDDSDFTFDTEVQSYPVARMLVSIIGDYRIINRYAQAEAHTARLRLEDDLDSSRDETSVSQMDWTLEEALDEFDLNARESSFEEAFSRTTVSTYLDEATPEEIRSFAADVFKIPTPEDAFSDETLDSLSTEELFATLHQKSSLDETELTAHSKNDSDWFALDFPSYLRIANEMGADEWRMTNRGIHDGELLVTLGDLLDLIEHAIYQRVSENLPHEVPDDIHELLFETSEEVREGIDDDAFSYEIDRVEEGLFPPVIEQMLEDFPHGLKHEERMTLGAFLIHIGMTVDEAVEFLGAKGTPGEDPTTYQLNHIASGGGSGEPYTPANYQTIEAWGYEWEKDALEAKVKNPLTYYKIKLKDADEEEDGEDSEDEADPTDAESVDPTDADADEEFAPSTEELAADAAALAGDETDDGDEDDGDD